MQDKNQQFEQRFIEALLHERYPALSTDIEVAATGLSEGALIDLFETQVMSRHLDLRSRQMQKQGDSFYTIGSAGHEGNAACALAFRPTDMAFLHYRSGAFMIQRSKQVKGQTPLYDMMLSFAASSEDPTSGGRHKVLGSKTLMVPPQTSTIASHLPKAVGAAFSITLSNRMDVDNVIPKDGVILCNFGDASVNHSTAQGAFNTACWAAFQSVPLPIVFICEDNGIGISTATPKGWVEATFSQKSGLTYLQCDGLNVLDTYQTTCEAVRIARHKHRPVFLHMLTIRLLGHAGSDAEFAYRDPDKIAQTEAQDPLLHSAAILVRNHILSPSKLVEIYQRVGEQVKSVSEEAARRPKLTSSAAVTQSLVPPKSGVCLPSVPDDATREALFAHEKHNLGKPQHMAKLLNWALIDVMARVPQTLVFGEDVGKKGGVYNVTSKLFERFGPQRVINTLLDEQSILGAAIGLAHNGFLPIPEIQFLAYLHNAEDQIRGEAATLPFFSNGQFTNPMVIRIAGLAYQRGFGGHFHNDNSLAVLRDIPGLVIACPSNGEDAVHMLRRSIQLALEKQRVVVFIEPIALYMKKDLHEAGDNLWAFDYPAAESEPPALGEPGIYGEGDDLCILTYGNGYYLSRQAEKQLAEQGIACTVVDLRWLAPLNEQAILAAVSGKGAVLIVDECRKTGSISEALMTVLVEGYAGLPLPGIKRVTADDSFIPLGSASYTVLPDVERIVDSAVSLVSKPDNNKKVAV